MSNESEIQHITQMDRGLAYAEACFETFRIIDEKIFKWPAHWQRLCRGLLTFGIQLQPSQEEAILNACLKFAKKTAPDCLVRLTISGGQADWGLIKVTQPSIHIQTTIFTSSSQNTGLNHALSVEYPFPLQAKVAKFTSDYANILKASHIWKQELTKANPQQFILCKKGQLISGLTSNIILYSHGQWVTPQGDGILNGVIRGFLVNQDLIQVQHCPVTLLDTCDAMLLLNSGQFIRPIHSINGRNLEHRNSAISHIQQILQAEQGVSIELH